MELLLFWPEFDLSLYVWALSAYLLDCLSFVAAFSSLVRFRSFCFWTLLTVSGIYCLKEDCFVFM